MTPEKYNNNKYKNKKIGVRSRKRASILYYYFIGTRLPRNRYNIKEIKYYNIYPKPIFKRASSWLVSGYLFILRMRVDTTGGRMSLFHSYIFISFAATNLTVINIHNRWNNKKCKKKKDRDCWRIVRFAHMAFSDDGEKKLGRR